MLTNTVGDKEAARTESKRTNTYKKVSGLAAVGLCCGLVVYKETLRLKQRLNWSKSIHEAPADTSPYIYIRDIEDEDLSCSSKTKAPLFPMLASYSEDPCTLLKLVQSDDVKSQRLGIEALAKRHNWHDGIYTMISQAIGKHIAVGLARKSSTDSRLFLKPPRLPATLISLNSQLHQLLSHLPREDVDQFTTYYTDKAISRTSSIKKYNNSEEVWSFDGLGLIHLVAADADPTELRVLLFCLHALFLHSKIEGQCAEIVQNGGLQVLERIMTLRQGNVKVQRYVAKIIANISVSTDLHEDLFRSGWVGILAKWLKSSDLSMSLLAAKALSNMDEDEREGGVLHDGIHLFHPHYKHNGPIYADIVFIHGLLGNPAYTWRQKDSKGGKLSSKPPNLQNVPDQSPGMADRSDIQPDRSQSWPKDWLAKDCANVRMLTIEYETELTEWVPQLEDSNRRTIAARGEDMLEKLSEAGLGKRPIIWVGHSLGGLLIKKMLELADQNPKYEDIIHNSNGVVFYSVPHRGSKIAAYLGKLVLVPSTEVQELNEKSHMLKKLHEHFTAIMSSNDIPLLSFVEGSKMTLPLNMKFVLVPAESGDAGFGVTHIMPELNHLDICKPESPSSALYTLTLKFIRQCISPSSIEHTMHPALGQDSDLSDVIY